MTATQSPVSQNQLLVTLLDDFSVEVTAKDVAAIEEARVALPPGTRVHITYLANEDLAMRRAAAKATRAGGFIPVPHLPARRMASHAALAEFLAALQADGAIENVFVVGGDPPEPEGPYQDSMAILRTGLLRRHGVRHASISGYPEGHPDIGEDCLWSALEDKCRLLLDEQLPGAVVTQFSFDVDPVLSWIAAVRARGIDIPIRVGVPGPAGVRRLLGYARRFGVGTGASIARKYGLSLTNLMSTAGPDRFVADLAAGYDPAVHGVVKLHFYTFGGLKQTADWVRDFRAGLD